VWGGNELRVREIEGAREGVRVRISHVHKSGDRINTAPVVTVQMMQFPLQIRYHRKKMLPLILAPDSTYRLWELVAWLAVVLVHAESTGLNSPIARGHGRQGRKQ